MNKSFMVSLWYKGYIGGILKVNDDMIVYHTNKLTVNKDYRNIEINIKNIIDIKYNGITVDIILKDNKQYKFLIFNIKKFKNCLNNLGIK